MAGRGLWTDDNNWWYNGLNQTHSWAGAENWPHFAPQRTNHLDNIWQTALADILQFRVTWAAISLVAIVAACSVGPAATPASPGQGARERVVVAYLAALERRDSAAIAAMVSPGVDATSDIASELDRYGGVRLHDTRVTYLDEFGGIYVVATVTGAGDDGSAYTINVPISRVAGNDYVALGQVAPSGSEANPSSPRP